MLCLRRSSSTLTVTDVMAIVSSSDCVRRSWNIALHELRIMWHMPLTVWKPELGDVAADGFAAGVEAFLFGGGKLGREHLLYAFGTN